MASWHRSSFLRACTARLSAQVPQFSVSTSHYFVSHGARTVTSCSLVPVRSLNGVTECRVPIASSALSSECISVLHIYCALRVLSAHQTSHSAQLSTSKHCVWSWVSSAGRWSSGDERVESENKDIYI